MLLRYARIARLIGLESPHFDTQVPKAIQNAKDVGLIDQVASQRCDAVNILLFYPVEPVGEPFAKSSGDPNAESALVPLPMAVIPHVIRISDNRGVLHPPAPKPPGVIPGAGVIPHLALPSWASDWVPTAPAAVIPPLLSRMSKCAACQAISRFRRFRMHTEPSG